MDRRRVAVLAAALLLPLAGLEARLVQLQILSPGKYTAELRTRRRTLEVVIPPRGRIVDRTGRTIAEDRPCFDLYVVPEEFEKSPAALAEALGLPPEEIEADVERIYRRIEEQMDRRPKRERIRILERERKAPYLLRRDIPFETAFLIETNAGRFPGAVVREGLRRRYPCGAAGAHVAGYVGRMTAEEYRRRLDEGFFTEGFAAVVGEDAVERLEARGVFQDELTCRDGAERAFDARLRGKCGLMIFEREPGRGRTMVELVPSVPGADVDLTIDIDLQRFVEGELAKTPLDSAAVVLDPRTGEALALASNRVFDPNDFVPPLNRAKVREYLDNQGTLRSVAYQEQYPLGSVFKIVTATAGLENRLIAAGTTIECKGKFRPELRHYNCHIWNKTPGASHGPLDLLGAMERSCNIYFYTIGDGMGAEGLKYWALQLGFGERTGLDLPAEVPGRLPARDALSFAIGQSELQVSPLQVAVAMSLIANGGNRVTPHVRRGGGLPPRETAVSRETVDILRKALQEVVYGEHGTASKAGLKELRVAGKTGSAQAGADRDSHAWFASYAPYDDPKYVVVVFVKHGGHGGETAAPVAARIYQRLLRKAATPPGIWRAVERAADILRRVKERM
ncbi:MAG: hypothetical protein HYY17_05710 [Planctomycetes bacterium]|nr:hypothetical protein [Planctomycetota bacterium]